MWTPRTQAVKQGESPFAWDVPSVYQCTWFCFYEALWHGMSAPTYFDRASKTGSYPNAKLWLNEYRDPWIPVTDKDYKPVQGDILVYDGEYGHVIFMETDTLTAEYRNGDPNSFRNAKLGDYKGVLLGVLHYPYETIMPVDRNENVPQIETTDESLRIRTAPSLQGEIVGHVKLGYYNVLQQSEADGYTWYEIATDRWCADITTKFYPADQNDFVKQIQAWADAMVEQTKLKDKKISELTESMKQINKISGKWE